MDYLFSGLHISCFNWLEQFVPIDRYLDGDGAWLVIATASASQDITIDALRIEQIGADEKSSMAAGAATAVVGWWSGYKIGGMLMLFIADWLEQAGHTNYWQLTFLYLCGFVCLPILG